LAFLLNTQLHSKCHKCDSEPIRDRQKVFCFSRLMIFNVPSASTASAKNKTKRIRRIIGKRSRQVLYKSCGARITMLSLWCTALYASMESNGWIHFFLIRFACHCIGRNYTKIDMALYYHRQQPIAHRNSQWWMAYDCWDSFQIHSHRSIVLLC